MKIKCLLCALFLGSIMPIFAQINNDDLAKRLATTVANVKAGEVVLIEGGKDQIELMEAIGEQIHKKGAFPRLLLTSERVEKAYLSSVPEEHFSIQHQAEHKLNNIADVFIRLPNNIDLATLESQAPKEHREKHNKLMKEEHQSGKVYENEKTKMVFVKLPNQIEARSFNVDYPIYEKMINEAIAADYGAIASKGKQIANLLKTGKKVKITTGNGTDFTFDLVGRPCTINDGVISEEDLKSPLRSDRVINLPSGGIGVTGLETSANGKVFVSRDKQGKEKITNSSFDFVNGKIQNYKAETNQAYLERRLKEADPMLNQFGGVVIGLNPALKALSDDKQDFRPPQVEGMVTVIMGGNHRRGGTNTLQDGFTLPLEKATVSVDGKVIVKDGKLVTDKLSSVD